MEGKARMPSCCAPLHLRIWICRSQSTPKETSSRKGAGDASRRASSRRNRKMGQSHDWACTCSRRSCSGRTWGSQAKIAPRGLALMSCSVVQPLVGGVGRAPDKVLRRQPQLGLPRCMRALRGHDQQQMAAARTNSLKLGASNRHAHNDDWGCSSSVSERQRQPRPQAAGRQAPQSRWAQR